MAEETTTTEPAKGKGAEKTEETTETAVTSQADNPDAVKNALAAERKTARDAAKRAEAAEAKVREFEDKDKSDLEKASGKAKSLEGELTTAKAENLRLRIALEKKIPAELVDRLKGTTEEEITADAEELLKLVGGSSESTTDFDGGARTPAKSGDMDSVIRRAAGRT